MLTSHGPEDQPLHSRTDEGRCLIRLESWEPGHVDGGGGVGGRDASHSQTSGASQHRGPGSPLQGRQVEKTQGRKERSPASAWQTSQMLLTDGMRA